MLSAGTIVVELAGSQNHDHYTQLLNHPLCDLISITASRPGVFSKWSFDFEPETPIKAKQALQWLQTVHQGLQGITSNDKLQLNMKIVGSQARRYPGMRAAIASLGPSILQLRVLQSLPDFVNNHFQLSGLKVLALMTPSSSDKILRIQSALHSLPSLEILHVFARSQASTDSICQLLQVLQTLPNVKSLRDIWKRQLLLRVATAAKACCVPAIHLLYVTELELGIDVTTGALPARLAQLCFEGSHQVVDSYISLFQQAEAMQMPMCISLQNLPTFPLQTLPNTLHSLSLLQPMGHQRDLLHAALAQLHRLKVLCVGDFLTQETVTMFTGLVFPQLHTFGFRIHCRGKKFFGHQQNCVHMECPTNLTLFPYDQQAGPLYKYVCVPFAGLLPLSVACPELKQLETYITSLPSLLCHKSRLLKLWSGEHSKGSGSHGLLQQFMVIIAKPTSELLSCGEIMLLM